MTGSRWGSPSRSSSSARSAWRSRARAAGFDVLWALAAAAGVALLGGFGASDGFGILLALVAGGFWAAYILLNARVGRAFRGGDGLAIAMAIATLPLIPFGIADAGSQLLHPALLAAGLGVALLSSVIPYSLELEALRRIRPQAFGVLMSLEPAMAALAGLIVIGQSLSAVELVGIALVITASAGATVGARGPRRSTRERHRSDPREAGVIGPVARRIVMGLSAAVLAALATTAV